MKAWDFFFQKQIYNNKRLSPTYTLFRLTQFVALEVGTQLILLIAKSCKISFMHLTEMFCRIG